MPAHRRNPVVLPCLVFFSCLACARATRAYAHVAPGDTIVPANASKVAEMVSPGVYYHVLHGMTMKIVRTVRDQTAVYAKPQRETVDPSPGALPPTSVTGPGLSDARVVAPNAAWPPPYRDATERYSSQVRLSPDGRSILNYVAGQPFPFLDPNDPRVAQKIIWNTVFRPISSDDYDLRFFDCEDTLVGRGADSAIDYLQIGHYAGYDEVGRTEVEPLPIDPDFLSSNRLWMFALYPILAPENLRGGGLIRWRFAAPQRPDATWEWQPETRRVRRLNEGLMSDAITMGGGNPIAFDPDHYSGFNAKTEEYDYRFIGKRGMLACIHAAHSPEVTCKGDGGATACPENWEVRELWIVEARPRGFAGGSAQTLQSKTVIYVDSELWFEPYVDEYDAQGRLWQSHIYWLTYRDRPVPGARIAIYPFKRAFIVGASATDVQSGASTMCYLPGRDTPEPECWYINMGEVGRGFFDTQSMVRAAP